MLSEYLTELKEILAQLKPYKAILFGSSVYGNFTDDSDIDLIVVLEKDDMPKNFDERTQNYSLVKKFFKPLKDKVPMDILVYTKSEWKSFINADNSFTREILERGEMII
ncbi:MAG: nucleotidyltransferase domain-containing protein [Desulfamplus sp.]|jgi:predicted nucleotidyltransferase